MLISDCFQRYDRTRSGLLPAYLFEDCLQAAGNRLPSKVVNLLIAYCLVGTTQDFNHVAHLSRLKTLIAACEPGNLEDKRDVKTVLIEKINERFGNSAKAFAYFDQDKVRNRQDGYIHSTDFCQAALGLGLARRQGEVRELFLSLAGDADKIDFAGFAALFARPNVDRQDQGRPSPQQRGIFVQHSNAPPAKWGDFPEEKRRSSPLRLIHLPSDRNPEHIYGRAPPPSDRIEDLLSHSFVLSRSPRKQPGRTLRLQPLPKQPINT